MTQTLQHVHGVDLKNIILKKKEKMPYEKVNKYILIKFGGVKYVIKI